MEGGGAEESGDEEIPDDEGGNIDVIRESATNSISISRSDYYGGLQLIPLDGL